MTDNAIEKFHHALHQSLVDGKFEKFTLSNYKGGGDPVQKISGRVIETRQGKRVLVQVRYPTREIAKNYPLDEAAGRVIDLLRSGFRNAHLFTLDADFQLVIGKRNSRLTEGKATFTAAPSLGHDDEKRTTVDVNAYYLRALGIVGDNGQVLKDARDKWRQINKFVEVLASTFSSSSLTDKTEILLVDFGSGKGYLTFAAYEYLRSIGKKVIAVGVDTKQEMIELCNGVAHAGGLDGLRFENSTIAETDIGGADIVIALHACDTATDEALFKGVGANAAVIMASPCCHKEVRRQIAAPNAFPDALKHGILLERTAETVTDSLRSMLLEREGYRSKVFDFVPSEHTPKNVMIAAVRRSDARVKDDMDEQIRALMSFYRIDRQSLYTLLS